MTEQNQVQAIGIDNDQYALDSLNDEAKNLVAAITNNRNLAQIHEQTKQQLDIANTALTNALKAQLVDVEPLEAAAPAEVEITED